MSETASTGRSARGSVVLLILGAIVGLVALATLAGGGAALWADKTQRDDSGYFTTSSHRFAAGGSAIVQEGVNVGDIPSWIDAGRLAGIKIDATSGAGRPLFVGIAPQRAVDGYLSSVGHSRLRDLDVDPFRASYDRVAGTARPAPPASKRFWVASAAGSHPTVTWRVREGKWGIVLMNADGTPSVAADVRVGADIGYAGWIWGGLLGIGGALLGLAALLVFLGARRDRRPGAGSVGAGADPSRAMPAEAGAYPAVLTARLDEPLSRGLWLVKWLLLIPHAIVLAILWPVFVVLTFVAWLAILATGRYPRAIFDFNVGVMRWTWRVNYYGYGALGTDRYPPFSLGAHPDYPARLDVAYPEHLSRGLALVKWLLALPHLVIVGVLAGGGYMVDWGDAWESSYPGLIAILALVAGGALLFTARYPRGLFDLAIGLNRWVLRTVSYVALMTDEYPPFRLDSGGDEPPATADARPVVA